MFFRVFLAITAFHSVSAQIYVDDFKLSKSPDVTHLRVEYHTSNNDLENDSMTYSLWKGMTTLHYSQANIEIKFKKKIQTDQHVIHVSQINQKFGQNFKSTRTEDGFIFDGSYSSLQFRIEEDTNSFALISVERNTKIADRLDDCFELKSQEISWYGGPQQRYQYWPVDRLTFDDYSYVTK